ncbi:MAG: DUF4160 domain-containing protein [Solirubrobacteraceae bacterium]
MPRISFFYGIIIRMYWNERDHPVPHFHAEYGDHVASIDMNGDMLAGTVPPRALRLVREWAQLHEDELLANWVRARNNEPLEAIDPLA